MWAHVLSFRHLDERKLTKTAIRLSSKRCKACLKYRKNFFSWPPTLTASAPVDETMDSTLFNKQTPKGVRLKRFLSLGKHGSKISPRPPFVPLLTNGILARGEGKGKSKDNDIVHSLSLCLISRLSGRLSFGRSGCRSDKGPLNPPGILMTQLHRRRRYKW